MLDDLDRSLRTLLLEDLPRVVEKIERDGFDVSFDIPNREFNSRLARPTLNLYLFNIQENRDRRGKVWPVDRGNGSVARRRPPVMLDCAYMVTAWSNEVEDEHRLLSGATRVFFRNPFLPEEALQGALADGIEIVTEVAQPESLKDIVDIWSVLDNDLRPSVRVTVTVPLEVDVDYHAPPVRDREIRLEGPDWAAPSSAPMEMAGRLVRRGRPVRGARVRVDSSSATTNQEGEFVLRAVRPGRKTVFLLVDGAFYQVDADLPREEPLEVPEPTTETAAKVSEEKENGRDRPRRRSKE